jgi:threonine dehydratase
MTTTSKHPTTAVVTARVAERTGRAPRLANNVSSRAVLPAAMGNRAFIRAWAARRAGLAARIVK